MAVEDRRTGLFNRVSIQNKFALAYGVILALLVLTCGLFYLGLRQVDHDRERSTHTLEVLSDIEALNVALLDQQSGLRGFLVKFDERFLQGYYEGIGSFDWQLDQIRELTRDNPVQQNHLAKVAQDMHRWREDVAEPAIRMFQNHEGEQEQQRSKFDQTAGKKITDEIRATLDDMRAEENRLLDGRRAALQSSLDNTRRLAALMLVAGIVFGIIVILSTSRYISQPLLDLSRLMTRLTGGDTDFSVPYRDRGDEVGGIGRALENFRVSTIDLSAREWVKTQLSQLSSSLQSSTNTQEFAKALIDQLCASTGAAYGAVFCLDEASKSLLLAGGYGMPSERFSAHKVALREGPIGQVADDGKARLLRDLPTAYFPLRTATGAAAPQFVYLLPLLGRKGVLGVVELALLAEPEARVERLLEDAMSFAGLNLEALLQGAATLKLLRATQQQKEELQASEEALRSQEEELRATNDVLREKQQQLEEQTHKLVASEEELRSQAEELRITNAQMEEKSLELSAQKNELEQAQAALEQKALDLEQASQYKSDFLANMSHELRTPLNSLLILAKGLADDEYKNLNDEQLESARIVYDSGKNLLNLINDILDLSKIEAGKMDAVTEEFDLKAFAASLDRNFRMVARERKLDFGVELDPALPEKLRSDPGKLNQIVTNLLSNAFKFTHEGRIELRIAPSGADAVTFSVRDSGIGIPPDKLARLFQAFEQGDSSTSRRYGGTGLGLSICRGLARLLGGEIQVQSVPGEGSTFSLLLPLQAGATVAATPPPKPASPKLAVSEVLPLDEGPAAILIVEDDRQFAEVLAGLSRAKGYRVLVAHDGEGALQLAGRNRLAGVMLDIGLPGMSGWQVMEALKENPRTQSVPVHFISGADEDGRARAMGAAGFLRKPVTQEQVTGLLDALPKPDGAPRRLLLVDDSRDERRLIRELLRDESVQIDECGSAEDALVKLDGQSYDLIVLDLGLPGMDGFEFLEVASKRGNMPPVVVHSGRELSREESMKLREYTDSIVLKSAPNTRRLLDEVTLFLHSIRRVAAPAEAAAPKPVTAGTLSGKTVLIVDDDMRNMFALSKALRGHGLKAVMAQDGPKALTQIENNPDISIVLMDIMMPGMDGYEAMQRIRANPKWATLPMIAVTAKAMTGDREKCLAAGANDYCPKPIDVDQLVQQMARLLAA